MCLGRYQLPSVLTDIPPGKLLSLHTILTTTKFTLHEIIRSGVHIPELVRITKILCIQVLVSPLFLVIADPQEQWPALLEHTSDSL